jgi:hypothetical protein
VIGDKRGAVVAAGVSFQPFFMDGERQFMAL